MELPMKLIIVSVILAIVLPAAFGGLYLYQRRQMELNVELKVDAIVDKIKDVRGMGNNSVSTLEIELPGKLMTSWKYVKIGDNIKPIGLDNPGDEFATRIRYEAREGHMEMVDAGCLVTDKEHDGPLVLENRNYFKLKFTKLIMNGVSFVSVEDVTYS